MKTKRQKKSESEKMPASRMRKGQISSSDLMIATSVFLVAIAVIYYLWINTNARVLQDRGAFQIEQQALFVSSALIKTPGLPTNWETLDATRRMTNISSIGLADERNVINLNKTTALKVHNYNTSCATCLANYTRAKQVLGVGNYGLHLNITNATNSSSSLANCNFDFGEPVPSKNTNITYYYVVSRHVVCNNTLALFNLYLWSGNTTGATSVQFG